MYNTFKIYVYLGLCCNYILSLRADVQIPKFKQCTSAGDCPDNSTCTKVETNLNCICWQGYQQNPNWSAESFNSTNSDYCISNIANKTVYKRQPPNEDHLAIAILLILAGVLIITLILYCCKVMRPIKRSQAVYRRLKLQRSNHHRLDEFDDIDMTFHDTGGSDEHL